MSGVAAGGIASGVKSASAGMGKVTVDDAVLFLTRFSGCCRQLRGRPAGYRNQNRNGFEINGSKGSLKSDFEDMTDLEFDDATRPREVQGGPDHVHPRRQPPIRGKLVARCPHPGLRAHLREPGI